MKGADKKIRGEDGNIDREPDIFGGGVWTIAPINTAIWSGGSMRSTAGGTYYPDTDPSKMNF